MTFSTTVGSSDWLQKICDRQPEVAKLLGASAEEQKRRGYVHTLPEILEQPSTWIKTSEQMVLLRELDQKNLGLLKLIVGEDVPADLLREQDVVMNCAGLGELGDDWAALIDVVVGQLLGFFRCLHEGLRPDSPSESGVINRVVQSFKLHLAGMMSGKRSPSRSEK